VGGETIGWGVVFDIGEDFRGRYGTLKRGEHGKPAPTEDGQGFYGGDKIDYR
jgi:hypothetical protein